MIEDKYSADLIADVSTSMGRGPVYKKSELSANTNMRNIMTPDFTQGSMGKQTFPKLFMEEEVADVLDGSYKIEEGDHIYSIGQGSLAVLQAMPDTAVPDVTADGNYRSILYWIPEKYAFRATASYGDDDSYANIGIGSIAMGQRCKASGPNSIAIGDTNSCTADSTFAFGNDNTCSAANGYAFGSLNTASGSTISYTAGWSNASSGDSSMCFGRANAVGGDLSFCYGAVSEVSGDKSATFGYRLKVTGTRSMAVGIGSDFSPNSVYTAGDDDAFTIVSAGNLGFFVKKGANRCNYGFGTNLFGTNADNVLSIINGAKPTGVISNGCQIYTGNTSLGSNLSTMGYYTEHVPYAFANETRVRVWWNGTEYAMPLYNKTESAITTVAAATYDTLPTDHIIHVTYTDTGVVTITLDTDDVIAGRELTIKDAGGGAGTYNITIDTEGAETIDGDATAIISSNYDGVRIYSDGNNWFIF